MYLLVLLIKKGLILTIENLLVAVAGVWLEEVVQRGRIVTGAPFTRPTAKNCIKIREQPILSASKKFIHGLSMLMVDDFYQKTITLERRCQLKVYTIHFFILKLNTAVNPRRMTKLPSGQLGQNLCTLLSN